MSFFLYYDLFMDMFVVILFNDNKDKYVKYITFSIQHLQLSNNIFIFSIQLSVNYQTIFTVQIQYL